MSVGVVTLVLLYCAFTTAEIPDGYIMKITPSCGPDGMADGVVNIVTDLNAEAKAICMNGTEVFFTTSDDVNFVLPFSYMIGSSAKACVFSQRAGVKVFFAKVLFSYGEPGSLVHKYTEEYTVTCTFGSHGSDGSVASNIDDALIAAKEIQNNMGSASPSIVTLKLVDVLIDDLAGEDVGLGKTVLLCATVSGSPGIKPVSCDAMDSSMNRYAVLRAGCGDGIVLDKNAGFTTDGTQTCSPYFDAFSINVDPELSFECNFTVCSSTCDGSSCAIEEVTTPATTSWTTPAWTTPTWTTYGWYWTTTPWTTPAWTTQPWGWWWYQAEKRRRSVDKRHKMVTYTMAGTEPVRVRARARVGAYGSVEKTKSSK